MGDDVVSGVRNEKPCLIKGLLGRQTTMLKPGEHQLIKVIVLRSGGGRETFFAKYVEEEGGVFGLTEKEWLSKSQKNGVEMIFS